ncbi:MAG: ATP synthase F1 subunit gamma [Candidatus Magasanikbacteria bacterium]|nr:ATP synthase F1 subunit gamma [Candidatus Magasanikbacteria bacterium]
MALSGRLIRSRIKSVKNTKKITKAMELVSAAKMRRSVGAALQSRQYAKYAWNLLLRLQSSAEGRAQVAVHPLLVERPVKKVLVIAVTSNRGLAGAFNSNVIKKAVEQIKNPLLTDAELDFVIVGKRGESAIRKYTKRIVASFIDISDVPKYADAQALISLAMDSYSSGTYDKVVVVYTDYVSALVQKPKVRQILPVSEVELEAALEMAAGSSREVESKQVPNEPIFEPSINEIITAAVTRLIESQVYQAILESSASEHSSRMMAMRQATDAATEMIDTLTLVFNQARQASITREISEISAGKAALE